MTASGLYSSTGTLQARGEHWLLIARAKCGKLCVVNFVGHIAAGIRVDGHREASLFLVGTALPDFASMARARLAQTHGALGAGIATHHAADHAFHGQAWFIDLERELRASLSRDGLPEGAARACAHVGPELLLDGALIGDEDVARAVGDVYDELADPPKFVVNLVAADERTRWREHLVAVTRRLDPHAYRDPNVVAQRLHAVASRRLRLAFDDDLIDTVAVRMSHVQPRITASAQGVVTRVVAAL